MKKPLFIPILLLLVIGCKKNSTSPVVSIVGTWHFNSKLYNTYNNGVINSTATTPLNGIETLTFNSDGSGIDKNESGFQISENITYQMSGTNLTLNYPGGTYNATIKVLTDNALVLHYDSPTPGQWSEEDTYSK